MTRGKKVFILILVLVLLALAFAFYVIRNLTYDYGNENFMEKEGKKLGFQEKDYQLEDGSILHYAEGPDNGRPLILLHGQQVDWKDYAAVLDQLSQDFHVFTIDYYGHGKSSKDPSKYKATIIAQDLIHFMDELVQEKAILAGHSSGALLAALIANEAPDSVYALVLEDGPFFSTEDGKAQNTFSWLSFQTMADYLNQDQVSSYFEYGLEHDYMQNFFNTDGNDNWSSLVKNPGLEAWEENPGEIPKLWIYPPELGVNNLYRLLACTQDGTGDYDLRFGQSFYDFSWFEGFDQEEVLQGIQCPTLFLKVAPSDVTAPGYYDENGILISALDEKDMQKVLDLVPNIQLVDGFKSDHDIHADLPEEYLQTLYEFLENLE